MHGLFTIGNDTPHVNGHSCATLVNDIVKSHSSFYEIIAITSTKRESIGRICPW